MCASWEAWELSADLLQLRGLETSLTDAGPFSALPVAIFLHIIHGLCGSLWAFLTGYARHFLQIALVSTGGGSCSCPHPLREAFAYTAPKSGCRPETAASRCDDGSRNTTWTSTQRPLRTGGFSRKLSPSSPFGKGCPPTMACFLGGPGTGSDRSGKRTPPPRREALSSSLPLSWLRGSGALSCLEGNSRQRQQQFPARCRPRALDFIASRLRSS